MPRRHGLYLRTKDIAVLHQTTDRSARNYIKKIRTVFGKLNYQPITLQEYCLYMQVDEASVLRVLYNLDD